MSWDIELVDKKGDFVAVPSFEEGGTYVLGGSTDASLNVTWNYSSFYHNTLDAERGIRFLDGKRAKDVVELLTKAIAELGTEKNDNYWASTRGNAGYALSILLKWAKLHPTATFKVI